MSKSGEVRLIYHSLIRDGSLKGSYLFTPPRGEKSLLGMEIAKNERKTLLNAGETIVDVDIEASTEGFSYGRV